MHKHIFIFISVFLFFSRFTLVAQVPDIWYFGQMAGLDFTKGSPPIAFTGSQMNTPAGCAVSQSGNFYSNGQTIWTGGSVLKNGSNLEGNMLSTQSVVMVELSVADSTYVFTTDVGGGAKGLKYNIISKKNFSSSIYEVVEKNHNLLPAVSEKLAIALHCNKRDYWVLAHGWNNNIFYAYRLGEHIMDTIPVTTQIGSVHGGSAINAAGYMKISLQSDKVAAAITGEGKVELFKFDAVNGTLSNPITINNIPNAYGVEFDFTGNVLYVSTVSGNLFQFNLIQWNQNQIMASKVTIANDVELFGALQRGYDNKIYMAIDNSTHIAVINFPQTLGTSCDFISNYVYLKGARSEAGLPQIFQVDQIFDVKGSKNCLGDSSFFEILGDSTRIDSVFWDFGDSLSTIDTSTLFSPWYIYPSRGVYKFTVLIYHCNQTDTLHNWVEIFGKPYADLGPDTSFCSNVKFELFGGYASDYLWHDSSKTATYTALDTGLYWVRLTNTCGADYDSVRINKVFPAPVFSLPSDTTLCSGDSIEVFSPFIAPFVSIWDDSISATSIIIKSTGKYYLEIIDTNNCKTKDDILVQFENFPQPYIGDDTTICIGQPITFNGHYPGSVLWNTGETTSDITVYNSGNYIVTISNVCGSNSDTLHLDISLCDQVVWVPNAFSPNGDGENEIFKPYIENVYNYQLWIYDRWGYLLFDTQNPNQGWDGIFKSKLLPGGAYVWKMSYKDYYSKEYTKYGFVILIR